MEVHSEADDGKKKKQNCCQSCTSAFQAKVIGTIERMFQRYGEFVGRRWYIVTLVSFVFALACGAAVSTMYEEKSDGFDLWLPSGSDFKKHNEFLTETFADSDVRYNSILVVAEEGSVLSADNVRAVNKLREDVVDLNSGGATWSNRCELQSRATAQVAGVDAGADFPEDVCPAIEAMEDEDADAEKVCSESHLLEIWAEDGSFDGTEDALSTLTDQNILDDINTEGLTSGLTGREMHISGFLGTVETDDDGKIISAKAMLLTFVEEGHEDDNDELDMTLDFEEKLINLVKDYEFDVDGLKVYPNAARSSEDIIGAAAESDQNLFFVGYVLVLIYVMVMLGRFNTVQHRIFLSLAGIISVGLGIITCYGVCSLFGIWGSNMNLIMPFMLLGIGIDDMFVIVQNFDTLEEKHRIKPLHERVGLSMKHAGVAVTITTVTDLMAFGLGATTVLPALSHFCIYAAMGIFFVFFYMITFFFGWFVLDQMRSEALRDACICCWKKPDWKPNECSQKSLLSAAFRAYADLLMKIPCRIVALVVTVILLGLSIWGVTQLEAEFDPNVFVNPGTYLRDYLENKDKYFPSNGMVGSVYIADVKEVYKKMDIAKELGQELQSMDILAPESGKGGFNDAFEAFVDAKIGEDQNYPETALEKSPFHENLAEFMFTYGRPFVPAVKFKEELTCSAEAPEIRVIYKDTEEHISKMNKMYDFTDKYKKKFNGGGSADVFPMSFEYFNYITMEILTTELVRNILLALGCVFLATLFLIADIFASIIVVVSVIMALIDLGGFMFFWGLNIDTIVSILVIIALGLSVDYSAHVAHAFMVATGTREERVHKALVDIGPAVLNGGFSTFLAFAMLMTSKSIIFLTFFKIFFLVVFFGLFHGLVFLPVVLSFIGPSSSSLNTDPAAVAPVPEPTSPRQITRVKSAHSVRAKSAFSVSRMEEED